MGPYLDAMRNYKVFHGRTSRAEYWRAHIVFGPLMLLAFVGLGLPFGGEARSVWPALLFLLIVLPHAVPWAALTVRRLHDMDQSGWWAVIAVAPAVEVVPFGLVALLLWCGQRGRNGPNRFGPDPLSREPMPSGEPARPSAAVVGAPVQPIGDLVSELERLVQLRADGTLTEDEFAVMKAHALARGGA